MSQWFQGIINKGMPVFAAVDIGSNSVRMSIARLERGRLIPLHEDREVTRLGESVFRTRNLDPQAMAQTIKVLRRFHRAIQVHKTDKVRVVATSAVRDAKNSRVFTEWVRSVTGWTMEVISGLDEGRLIHLGVVSNARVRASRLLLLDLGGGSCELTISNRGHIKTMVSMPLGAVRLTTEFLHHDPPRRKELNRMNEFIGEELSRVEKVIAKAKPEMVIATSGTAAALAGAAARLLGKGKSTKRGMTSRTAIARLAAGLEVLSREERASLPGINAKRAEIIVAGAAVFAQVFTRCGLAGYRYTPLGLRDGLLAQMAAEFDSHTRSGKQIEADRWDALVAAGERYHVDMDQAQHERKLALQLFKVLKPVHGLANDYAEWLSAAAMLHEVGMYVNRAARHRHTYYIIANSEIFGDTPRQRQLIAAIARYQGNSKPQIGDRIIKQLPPGERGNVVKAVLLLRLARALDFGDHRAVKSIQGRVSEGRMQLKLKTGRGGAELEMWAIEKEFAYFREVFGRELAVAAS